MLIGECRLSGETRADRVAPAHPNGLQLSRDRFILFNATTGFRGVDDSLSTTYQIRAGDYDGATLAEGVLARSVMDWDPLNLGVRWKKETGAPIGASAARLPSLTPCARSMWPGEARPGACL